jgi:SAM-dependent methyltransferase
VADAPLYAHPRWYDIAFSWRDTERDTGVMAACCERFGRGRPRRVLEVACGHGPCLEAIARRDWRFTGLDSNPAMLAYARERAEALGVRAEWLEADMADFTLHEPVDLAFVLLGSLYLRTTEAVLAHLGCVRDALHPGGLYLLEWAVQFDPLMETADTWDVDGDGIRVRATVTTANVDRIAQLAEERVSLTVREGGDEHHIEHAALKRLIFPQEFLLLVAAAGGLEFVGWWNDWDLDQPLHGNEFVTRPIIVLRKPG